MQAPFPCSLRRARALLLLLSLPLACAGDEDGTSSSFSGSGVSGLTSAGVTAASATEGTGTGSESEGASASSGEDSQGSTTGGATSPTTSASASASGGDTNPGGLPNGGECTDDAQCMSDNCYEIPLPVDNLPSGVCGICDEDADCVDLGLGIACTIDVGGYQTKCTDGGIGSFCESQAACKDGLFCDELIDGIGGLLPMACGTCQTDAECNGSARCTPKIDVVAYSGHKYCAELGSVANDGLCPMVNGDPVCASGTCAVVDLGLVKTGVCGQCKADGDCPNGQVCQAGKFDSGFVGSTCG